MHSEATWDQLRQVTIAEISTLNGIFQPRP
jgi:hypothetical protein